MCNSTAMSTENGASMTLKLHPKQQNNGPNHGLSPGLEHKHEGNQEDASDVGFSLFSAGKRCAKKILAF